MELTLSMQEIYFLGKHLNGDHLNYNYIAAMSEISQRRAVLEQECKDALVRIGVAEESLTGDFTICQPAIDFLHPLYFGDFESDLAMEDSITHEALHWMFHREPLEHGLQWLAAELTGETARFMSVTQDTVSDLFQKIPLGSGTGPMLSDDEITGKVSKVLTLKNLAPDGAPTVIMYLMADNCWYEQTQDALNRPVTPEEFQSNVRKILQGGENGWHTTI